jgi:hypothetical protein
MSGSRSATWRRREYVCLHRGLAVKGPGVPGDGEAQPSEQLFNTLGTTEPRSAVGRENVVTVAPHLSGARTRLQAQG